MRRPKSGVKFRRKWTCQGSELRASFQQMIRDCLDFAVGMMGSETVNAGWGRLQCPMRVDCTPKKIEMFVYKCRGLCVAAVKLSGWYALPTDRWRRQRMRPGSPPTKSMDKVALRPKQPKSRCPGRAVYTVKGDVAVEAAHSADAPVPVCAKQTKWQAHWSQLHALLFPYGAFTPSTPCQCRRSARAEYALRNGAAIVRPRMWVGRGHSRGCDVEPE